MIFINFIICNFSSIFLLIFFLIKVCRHIFIPMLVIIQFSSSLTWRKKLDHLGNISLNGFLFWDRKLNSNCKLNRRFTILCTRAWPGLNKLIYICIGFWENSDNPKPGRSFSLGQLAKQDINPCVYVSVRAIKSASF